MWEFIASHIPWFPLCAAAGPIWKYSGPLAASEQVTGGTHQAESTGGARRGGDGGRGVVVGVLVVLVVTLLRGRGVEEGK